MLSLTVHPSGLIWIMTESDREMAEIRVDVMRPVGVERPL